MSTRVLWVERQRRWLRRDRYRFAVSVAGGKPVICTVPVGPHAVLDASDLITALEKGTK